MSFNEDKTCAFSGHRIFYGGFDVEKLKKEIENLLVKGYNTFLVGMALGFDTVCFKLLEELRETNKLRIVACIPCLSQAEKFSVQQKYDYNEMLESVDYIEYVSEEYFTGCMQKRNRFMVDNSSVLIAYLKKESGGTFGTVKYAQKCGKKIIFIV